MAKGYLVAHIRVHDKERFADFKSMAGPGIRKYGGKVLVLSPNADHREGELRGLTVLLEFESVGAAQRFYEPEEYTAAKTVREEAAQTDLLLVEGNKFAPSDSLGRSG